MLTIKSLAFFLCLGFFVSVVSAEKLRTVYEWKFIDYLWDHPDDKIAAEKSGDYNRTSPIVIDVDTWEGRVFVTVIRTAGVPASLTTVSDEKGEGGPLLKPYPDWSWAQKGNCSVITNVYRVAIDECDRMWVLDTGVIDGKQICEAQLLVFNLRNDKLIKRIKIDNEVSLNSKTKLGSLVTPIVETEGHNCENTHVYMADVEGHGLVVFNGEEDSITRFESPYFSPQRSASDVEIVGETFNLEDGVLGMALSPKIECTDSRKLFFRPFASHDMISLNTSDFRLNKSSINLDVSRNMLPSPAVAMAVSSKGVLFFGLTTETSLACWNMKTPMTHENIEIVDKDIERYQFASGLKIIPKERTNEICEEIWMATNRYQKIASDTQNFDEINFRIMKGCVDDLAACTEPDTTWMWDKFFGFLGLVNTEKNCNN